MYLWITVSLAGASRRGTGAAEAGLWCGATAGTLSCSGRVSAVASAFCEDRRLRWWRTQSAIRRVTQARLTPGAGRAHCAARERVRVLEDAFDFECAAGLAGAGSAARAARTRSQRGCVTRRIADRIG